MDARKQYIYTTTFGIMNGLAQALDLEAGVDYGYKQYNCARTVSLTLRHINPTYLPKIAKMQDQLTMWAGLDKDSRIRINYQDYGIIIEIPKPKDLWKKVTIEGLERRRNIPSGPIATLGLGESDKIIRLDFRRPDVAHTFITGATRSGKTNTQKLIAWNLAHHCPDARMIIFDVAKRGFKWHDFANVANLAHPVVTEAGEADQVLAWASQEIERRADQRRTTPKTFLFIDEVKALLDSSNVAKDYLNRLASLAGEFGLHLVLSTQYPQSSVMGTGSAELKRNVTTRLCGKVDDATAAVNALGIAGSGADALQGYGDFLLKDSDSLYRLAVTLIESRHIEALPRIETVESLALPDEDQVGGGPPSNKQPEPIEPEQAATALFKPMGINRLGNELSIGSTKAKRVKEFADKMKDWAIEHGYRIGDNHGWTEFDYYDPIPH